MNGKLTTRRKGSALSADDGKSTTSSSVTSMTPEDRMNLTALKRRDPYIARVIGTASQVALYLFNEAEDAWVKSDVEGTLFVYERSAAPSYGFTISNRKVIALGTVKTGEMLAS